MKAILSAVIKYSGLRNGETDTRLEGTMPIKARISLPAIPSAGQSLHLSGDVVKNSSQEFYYDQTVRSVIWCPVPGQENVLEPWIFLEEFDVRDACETNWPKKTIDEVREHILTDLRKPTKASDLKAGNVRFVLDPL